jgi:hypothetical protein
MQHYLEGSGICSNDDEFGDAPVECFGGFIGSLFDLLQACTLGHQIIDFGGELLGGEGLGTIRGVLC